MTTLIEQLTEEKQEELLNTAKSAISDLEKQIQRCKNKLDHVKTVEFTNCLVEVCDNCVIDLRRFI